jgi:hypothetical protein
MVTPLKTDPLLVSRRDPETRRYSRVGVLSHDRHIFRFKYDDGVTRALPGLPLGRVHESKSLFPSSLSGSWTLTGQSGPKLWSSWAWVPRLSPSRCSRCRAVDAPAIPTS